MTIKRDMSRRTTGRSKPSAGGSADFDAFISYSHKDRELAHVVQVALQQFAKPWYRLRALRIFLDEASLGVQPRLWESIEDALENSRWFIFFASPDAAESEWVNREVQWWLYHRPTDTLLIVATSPGLAWDKGLKDWSLNAPVPPALRGMLAEEPRWADLTALPRGTKRLRVPDELIADIAAPIKGRPKDELIGDHVRERRRARRLIRVSASVLILLTVTAIAASIMAVNQRTTALIQTRVATSRQVAALAEADFSAHLDLAQLLAVAAFQMDKNPQTQAALFQAVAAAPHLVRYLQVGSQIVAATASADGTVVVVGTADGQLVRFDLRTGARQGVWIGDEPVSGVAVDASGSVVVATDRDKTVVWKPDMQVRLQRIGAGGTATSVAVSPSGRFAAILNSSSSPDGLTVENIETAQETHTVVPRIFDKLMFPSEKQVMVLNDTGGWEKLQFPGFHQDGYSDKVMLPASGGIIGDSPDASYSADVEYGNIVAWRNRNPQGELYGGSITSAASAISLALSPDGKWAAIVGGGTIYMSRLAPLPSSLHRNGTVAELTANGNTSGVAFLGNDTHLMSISGTAVALWNLQQMSRLGKLTGATVPIAAMYGFPPELHVSPDGRMLVLIGGAGGMSEYRIGSRFVRLSNPSGGFFASWRRNEPLFFVIDRGGFEITDSHGRVLRGFSNASTAAASDRIEGSSPIAGQAVQGDARMIVVDQSGTIWSINLHTRSVNAFPVRDPGLQSQETAISSDGRRVAEYSRARGQVLLIDMQTKTTRVVGQGAANGITFAGNQLLIQRASGSLQIWNGVGTHLLRTLPGSGGSAYALAVSPNRTLLARLSDNGTASITSISSGQVLANFSLPVPVDNGYSQDPWLATAMLFTTNGRSLLTATTGGQVTQWDVNVPTLVNIACATVGRPLTRAEWEEYVHATAPARLPCMR